MNIITKINSRLNRIAIKCFCKEKLKKQQKITKYK